MFQLLMSPPVAHAIGIIAFCLIVYSFQINNRRSILKYMSSGLAFLGLHLLLLGGSSGAAMVFASVARNQVFLQKEKYAWARHPGTLYITLVVFVILGLIFWEGWISIFPILGSTAGVVTFWMDSTTRIRILTLLGAGVWIPYSLWVESYSSLAVQIFILVSVVIAMYRYDREKVSLREVKKHLGVD